MRSQHSPALGTIPKEVLEREYEQINTGKRREIYGIKLPYWLLPDQSFRHRLERPAGFSFDRKRKKDTEDI